MTCRLRERGQNRHHLLRKVWSKKASGVSVYALRVLQLRSEGRGEQAISIQDTFEWMKSPDTASELLVSANG